MASKHLRVEVAGWPINDYRIHDGHLEVRLLDVRGHSYRDARSAWKALNSNDLAFHFTLQTVVAHWFQDKLKIGNTKTAA